MIVINSDTIDDDGYMSLAIAIAPLDHPGIVENLVGVEKQGTQLLQDH